jgi:hypothetical protein
VVDRKLVAAGLYEALEQADRDLRKRYRHQFRIVDQIKRTPGWRPFATDCGEHTSHPKRKKESF